MRARNLKKLLIGVFCVLLLVGLIIGYRTTRATWFCGSCHAMEPFLASLSRDVSHRDLECAQCHLPDSPWSSIGPQTARVVSDTLANFKDPEDYAFRGHVKDRNC